MEINPQTVRGAEFKTVRKGADPDEVRVFLNDVADELERAQNQSTAMEARARAAVARLQELTEAGAAAPATTVDASAEEAETISRTLLLAQRTADSTVAEARREAARIVGAANDEAATTLDSTREMVAQLLDEARTEARRVGEAERNASLSAVESLKARRDFLESDVEQLELFLTEQRNRLREAATSLLEITERVPGGLGEVRAPLLSASDDEAVRPVADPEPSWSTSADVDTATQYVSGSTTESTSGSVTESTSGSVIESSLGSSLGSDEDMLRIVTEIAQSETTPASGADELSSDPGADETTAMSAFSVADDADGTGDGNVDNDFRFSFDDEAR